MKNEGKEDDAQKLITALNDMDPVLVPDAFHPFYLMQKEAQSQVIHSQYASRYDSITKQKCGTKIAVISVKMKASTFDNIELYYQTFNEDGTKIMSAMVKASDDNCADDPPLSDGKIMRNCQYLIGHLNDQKERGLGQKDNSIWGWIHKDSGIGYKQNQSGYATWCDDNNPASCTETIRSLRKAFSKNEEWKNRQPR